MLSDNEIEMVLNAARSSGADFAELFFENRKDHVIKNSSGTIDAITTLMIHGVGLYLLKGTDSVYIYSNDTSVSSLIAMAKKAAAQLCEEKDAVETKPIVFTERTVLRINVPIILPSETDIGKKVKILNEVDCAARKGDVNILSLSSSYFDHVRDIDIYNSEGLCVHEQKVETRLRLNATISENGKSSYAFFSFTKPEGFEVFDKYDVCRFAQDALLSQKKRLDAQQAKSMVCPVVFGPQCGTFWHEACGHNLETTAINGCFAGKLGQMIASEKVTLIDDGSIDGLYGSESVDDEGCATRKNVLIDHGRMVDWLKDRKGARLTKTKQNGCARRQSYCFAPAARMHNTYLAKGTDRVENIIGSVDKGLYVETLGGGSSGVNFSVAVEYGYLIEKGRLSTPVSGLNLSGNSLELIQRVDMVGDDLVYPEGGEFCGAGSGLVGVTDFTPTFRISHMNVGGKE